MLMVFGLIFVEAPRTPNEAKPTPESKDTPSQHPDDSTSAHVGARSGFV